MDRNDHQELAQRYCVDDMPGARQLGARLNGILLKIDAAELISPASMQFLADNGLRALHAYVGGRGGWSEFARQAARERDVRVEQAIEKAARDAAALEELKEARAAAAKATFAAMANDPMVQRRQESKELRSRFGVGYVEPEHYPRVLKLLRQLDTGQQLQFSEAVWLQTEADYCWTDEVRMAWHAAEAEVLTAEWKSGADGWAAVNACSHWRKAGKPTRSLDLTADALSQSPSDTKLRTALVTTRGGAMRDLGHRDEAISLATEAHELSPRDYRPCTLMGALLMESGDLSAGQDWYERAESLGAPRQAIDGELRALIARATPEDRNRILDFLLRQDRQRFGHLARNSART